VLLSRSLLGVEEREREGGREGEGERERMHRGYRLSGVDMMLQGKIDTPQDGK
jgi:hypothetical protein